MDKHGIKNNEKGEDSYGMIRHVIFNSAIALSLSAFAVFPASASTCQSGGKIFDEAEIVWSQNHKAHLYCAGSNKWRYLSQWGHGIETNSDLQYVGDKIHFSTMNPEGGASFANAQGGVALRAFALGGDSIGLSAEGQTYGGAFEAKSAEGYAIRALNNTGGALHATGKVFVEGRVGVGTYEPHATLHIKNGAGASTINTGSNRTLFAIETSQTTDGSNSFVISNGNGVPVRVNTRGGVYIDASHGRNAGTQVGILGHVNINNGAIYSDFDTKYVGIGTTTPESRLHIIGAENTGTDAALRIQSGSQVMLIDGNEISTTVASGQPLYLNYEVPNNVVLANGGGNVGIGIGSGNPTEKLQVNGLIDVTNNRILRVATPTATTDAANKSYVDTLGGRTSCTSGQVLKWNGTTWACAGDSIGMPDDMGTHIATQELDMAGNAITNLADPTNPQEAATKAYVDAAVMSVANCETGPIGTACSDGAIYAGELGGIRIYAAANDESGNLAWNNGSANWVTTGTSSTTDGLANTNTLVGLSDAGSPYVAAMACRARGPSWYLPSTDELNVLFTNKEAIGGLDTAGTSYWASTESSSSIQSVSHAWLQRVNDGGRTVYNKNFPRLVRCVRQADTGGDNLGDHTATRNIILNGHWLSGDGDDEGIFVDAEGNVAIATNTKILYGEQDFIKIPAGSSTVIGLTAEAAGTSNTVVGFGAGKNATKSSHTLLGTGAGASNTGSTLTSVGVNAGVGNTGNSVTAMGYFSGHSNTGNLQTVYGSYAGRNNKGSYHTAFGYSSGEDNTGNYTSTFGYAAGKGNKAAQQTAVGANAGHANEGSDQAAFGHYAGHNNTGSQQTAVGANAGRNNSGFQQTAIGFFAGAGNTGARQTVIGYYAGQGNTGNNLVAIGYQAGYQNTTDNQFIVQQRNINTAPLIQGDFSTGNIEIGNNITATAYYQSSDRNLKADIERISDPFALLNNIEGKRFVWKDSKKPAYGVIAQDVEAVMPDAVGENEEGFKTVEYDQLIAPLIEAVKQLDDRVRHLEAANGNLKADNDNLREEIRAMTKGVK